MTKFPKIFHIVSKTLKIIDKTAEISYYIHIDYIRTVLHMRRFLSVILAVATVFCLILSFPATAADRTVGDINLDGRINGSDALLLKKLITGTYTVDDERVADLNGDGRINGSDSLLLKKVIGGTYNPPVISDGNNVSLADYTVIYPADATEYELYAVEILCRRLSDTYGITVASADDATAETEHEILIGATSRSESTTDVTLANNQYMFMRSGEKLVLQGKDYMIGGAVAALCGAADENGMINLDNVSSTAAASDYAPACADSVILMIGDGMGANHITFTNLWAKKSTSWPYNYNGFTAAKFPASGKCTTLSITDLGSDGNFSTAVTDSAAAATALATGWKTQNGKLGINGFGTSVKNIRELAAEKGLATAVLSTEATTGATPSGFTVHNISRQNKDEIAAAQQELTDSGSITYLKGDMPGEHDLLSETKTALTAISSGTDGFFAMIEEAYIDKACDISYGSGYTKNDIAMFVSRFDEAIKYAATFCASRPGTVLIVTADHETGALSAAGEVTNNGKHTDLQVPVYAMGYGTEIFNGTVCDNSDIARFMASVYGESSFGGDYSNMN